MSDSTAEAVPVLTAYFVVVGLDGVISVHTSEVPSVSLHREATLYDIETYGSQLVRNVSRLLTAQIVGHSLQPEHEPTASERVSEALSKRKGD